MKGLIQLGIQLDVQRRSRNLWDKLMMGSLQISDDQTESGLEGHVTKNQEQQSEIGRN